MVLGGRYFLKAVDAALECNNSLILSGGQHENLRWLPQRALDLSDALSHSLQLGPHPVLDPRSGGNEARQF
jgi:hypothetical protein